MKKLISAVSIFCVFVMLFTLVPSAAKTYQTYTYSYTGTPLDSPDVYTPIAIYDSTTMGLSSSNKITDPQDMVVDDEGNIYISDSKSNRVIVLDSYFKYKYSISKFVNNHGVPDEFNSPQGLYVTEDRIFVCDNKAGRIVTFDRDGNFMSIIEGPDDDVLTGLDGEKQTFSPIAIAVDKYDRLFIVSDTTDQGVIVMTINGDFIGLIGAQAVAISAIEIVWRRIMTDEMREETEDNISYPFNNITIDEDGFIYVTVYHADLVSKVKSFLKSSAPWDGDYSPVKMLNAEGDEIMRRNGFFPPAGEIQFGTDGVSSDPSRLVDVAVGPEKTWSIIDADRDKVFTYDFDGNLLFAFGDKGSQLGTMSENGVQAITYLGDKMLILDKVKANITVFERTEYGDILINALKNQNERNYELAVDDWREILKRNSNFDAAYIGIGKALYRSGEYEEAISYYKTAYDTSNYSDSYKEIRKEWISKYILLLLAVIVAVIAACVLFLKYAAKVNKRATAAGGKRTFKEELLYGFHLWLHPFDGFWDLKHEKRGSLRAAIVYLAVTVVAFFYQAIGEGYVSNPQGSYTTIWSQAVSVLVPVFLFVVANWCLTTLFDGEGSFRDVTIAVSYSLLPLPVFIIPTTILTNFALSSEIKIINFVVTLAFIWTGILIFFGMMVTHGYTMYKNIVTLLGTIVGMAFIMFIGILFSSLLGNLVSLISNLITEIHYRT